MKKATVLVLGPIFCMSLETTRADFAFSSSKNVGPAVNSSAHEGVPGISADCLELYFRSNRTGGYGSVDLWVTTRDTLHDEWGTPTNLGPAVNSPAGGSCPSVSADGLALFFMSSRPGGYGDSDLWMTTRTATRDPWGEPVNLGPTLNGPGGDGCPSISADGLSLFFRAGSLAGVGGQDLWVTTRATVEEDWGPPMNLGAGVNTPGTDCCPSISADGLALFFHSDRSGGSGGLDLWVTTRATISEPWSKPVNLGPTVNSSANEHAPEVSSDGSTLFFDSDRPAGDANGDLWQASIEPVVDFNGDGVVDSSDMCIMIDYWDTGDSICDIGPMPWGDGVVDVEDLKVLAGHLFENVDDPTLVAHWPMDEAQGGIAYNSVADNDGTLVGDPAWQSESGMLGGAIALDGVDDHISTGPAVNPTEGTFSVLAWVKGGAPGQVILSQEGGRNWLMADTVDGGLRTDLRTPATTGRGAMPPGPPLISPAVITDGDWHRLAFVRDATSRILYVDSIEVARDAAENLESVDGGLYIGAGSNLEQGTFFSGLIDDVRIYNRAVKP